MFHRCTLSVVGQQHPRRAGDDAFPREDLCPCVKKIGIALLHETQCANAMIFQTLLRKYTLFSHCMDVDLLSLTC
jgi:hypothetical protein